MRTRGRVHDMVLRHRTATDVALAVMVLVGVVVASSRKKDIWATGPQTAPVLVLEVLAFAALLMRRDRPRLALGVIVVSATAVMMLLRGWSPLVVAAVIAVFTVSSTHDRRTALVAGLGTGSCLLFGGALHTGAWVTSQSIGTLAWSGFAAALGQAVHSQRAYIAAVEERARRAEQTREEEAARRVLEERLRIARELHDVVAHHIAVVQVQSGVADHLLAERPEAAREALGHVRRSSKAVLEELSSMLDLLRQPDDPVTPTDPAPGLARLTALIDQFAASGLHVDWRVTGTPTTLPAAVDLVAYRLVQEGLTNAHKHGTGPAEMALRFEPSALEIDIVNRIAVPVGVSGGSGWARGWGPGAGHGLAGMRERAHAVAASVSASARDDGTWQVIARMPLAPGRPRAAQEKVVPTCLRWSVP